MASASAALLLVQVVAIRQIAAVRPKTAQQLTELQASTNLAFNAQCNGERTDLWTEYAQYQQRTLSMPNADRRMIVWSCAATGCGGIGNMLRGISVALYTAMITRRSFFLQPSVGPDSWPEPNQIDWRVPKGASLRHCQSINRMCARGDCNWEAVLDLEAPCLLLETNSVPSQWWDEVEGKRPQALVDLRGALGSSEFLCGCALRFLFDFSRMQRELGEASEDGGVSFSKKYVAVHMRLGDAYMHGKAFVGAADEERMREALTCARELGQKLFAPGVPFDVFFASDSSSMRQRAPGVGKELGLTVVEQGFTPVHTQCCSHMPTKLWGDFSYWIGIPSLSMCHGYCQGAMHVWGDFLTLLDADGLVSAGSSTGAADLTVGDLDTKGVSDYSQIPAQYAFMPYLNQRRVAAPGDAEMGEGSCLAVTPGDTRVIV